MTALRARALLAAYAVLTAVPRFVRAVCDIAATTLLGEGRARR